MPDTILRGNVPLFDLGAVVATPGARDALCKHPKLLHRIVARHAGGDWGEVEAQDRRANDRALVSGERLLSAYTTPLGQTVWVITEADRSSTCVLLPNEY